MSRGRWRRPDWTQAQLDMVEAFIAESEQTGELVHWSDHTDEIGQPLPDITTMANRIRTKRYAQRQRAYNKVLRARADGADVELPRPAAFRKKTRRTRVPSTMPQLPRASEQEMLPEPVRKPRDICIDHRCSLSTQVYLVDIELRLRVATQGATAGLLGDPPAGRSALDKRRAGIVEPPRRDRRDSQLPKKPTLRQLTSEVTRVERALAPHT